MLINHLSMVASGKRLLCRNRYARLAGQQAGGSAVKLGVSAKRQAYIALQVNLP